MKKTLENIALKDGRYSPNVVRFVYEGLRYTTENLIAEPGHITGKTLCKGLKSLAVKKWGRLAKLVLNTAGVKNTHDFGEIVYMMIKNEWMSAQSSDRMEDFDDVYDFQTEFKGNFKF